jgi:hypothetical protein
MDGSFAGARTLQQLWFGSQGKLGSAGITAIRVCSTFGQQ